MKNWQFSLLLFLILLCVVLGIYFLLLQSKQPAVPPPLAYPTPKTIENTVETPATITRPVETELTPADVVTSLYRWYINGLAANIHFTSSPEYKTSLPTWLTQDFISHLESTATQIDADPILLAQDYGSSWLTNMTVTMQNKTIDQSTVILTLGVRREVRILNIHLVYTQHTWLIDSISQKN